MKTFETSRDFQETCSCLYLCYPVVMMTTHDANGLAQNQAFAKTNKCAPFCILMTHVQPE